MEHIRFASDGLTLLDQRVLPREVRWVVCRSAADAAEAIRAMVVRGAPAIGISAAYGMALDALAGRDLDAAAAVLRAARPTAVNLAWAVDRMRALPREAVPDAARALHADDVDRNRRLGAHGAALLPRSARVYTHCNAGALATGGYGTALGIVRAAAEAGKLAHVWVGETRPWLQGARLTAWECAQEGFPCTLVSDTVAASLMQRGAVDAVLVGADRVAANGDVANKVGTLGLAVLARHFGVAFHVAVPLSTLDAACPDGSSIPIEERGADEVRGHGGVVWAADVPVHNPAFDVTPAALVTAWVTEDGPWRPTT